MTTPILIITILLILTGYLSVKLHNIRGKEKQMLDILEDIQQGNLKRRLLANSNDMTAEICYKINEIVGYYEAQLAEMNATERANRQILTSLSHDVRTPLTTLIGYLDAMADGTVMGVEKEQYIQTAQSKAYALKNYIDDLFEWFKINSNEKIYHLEPTDINELTRNIVSDWIVQFETLGLDYTIDVDEEEVMVDLDRTAYTRILNNLVQNAIKHSNGSQMSMATKVGAKDVQVTVTDNGAGILPKDLPHIFDRLYRSDASRPTGNSGLGLSIVKQLVKAHGGDLSVTSEPHVATTFLIKMKRDDRFDTH